MTLTHTVLEIYDAIGDQVFFWVDGQGCPGYVHTLTNLLPGSIKCRPSTMLKLENSQEITLLRPDPGNQTVVNCVWGDFDFVGCAEILSFRRGRKMLKNKERREWCVFCAV